MTTVIYHSADFDGLFCRDIARKFLPNAKLVGWNFGDPKLEYPNEGQVYVLDLSPDCFIDLPHRAVESLIWIDHHKSSIDKWPTAINGYRIDGVAACRLAWQWFAGNHHDPEGEKYGLPTKVDFVDRVVTTVGVAEPTAIRLAGEYDIWDKRDPRVDTFQFALRCTPGVDNLTNLLNYELETEELIHAMLEQGKAVQYYCQKLDASICTKQSWLMEWEGLRFLCINHARFNSLLFAAKDIPETGHEALLGFRFDGKQWMVSLYHANHRKDLDLSLIAVKHGGGGHKGACGFVCKTLPFNL